MDYLLDVLSLKKWHNFRSEEFRGIFISPFSFLSFKITDIGDWKSHYGGLPSEFEHKSSTFVRRRTELHVEIQCKEDYIEEATNYSSNLASRYCL